MAISENLSESDYKNALQPVAPSERIQELDILRGFALFGVLLAYTLWNLGSPPEAQWSNADRILNGVLSVLIDTKFYTLFAFMFGLGFAIQLTRAEARGVSVVPVYCRRLAVLLLIGLAHALLLRNGDVLVPYAVMGFILLLFRRASNKALLAGGIIGLVYPYLARGVWDLTGIPFPRPPTTEDKGYLADNFAWVQYWYSIAIQAWPASLPMFLAGLYVGRRRFFEKLSAYGKKLKWVLIAGLSLGVIAFVIRVLLPELMPNSGRSVFRRSALGLLWSAHAWGLASFYVAGLLLLMKRPTLLRWLAPLGAVGRMALTNYLLQAAIIVPICIVFDLFDKVTPSLGLALAIGVSAFQVAASMLWLRRYRFGPVEWIWRTLTYGRRP